MADEIIGSVAVQIEADASDLQGQFEAAVAQATAAGGQIAQGINTGSQGFDSLSTAAGEFTSVISGLKALGIASTIEEIGSSSLEAYASLQKATIALTSLTGSAAQAQSEIANLRTIAQDDALSFPALVSANQRFTALGVSANQIPSALTAAANAAAAMNVSFDQAANAMERITSSGTLSSRVLVQLGISLQDVASSMGVSSADVVKDFKAITDEGTRLSILTDAMSKLQGTAEAVADSLSGSFQRVQNTMLTTFQQIGESIAPAAKDLADLAQVVIPEVGQAVQALVGPTVSIIEFGKALVDAKDSIGSFVDTATGVPGLFKEIGSAAQDSGVSLTGLVPGMDLVTEGFTYIKDQIEAYVNEGPNIVTMSNLIVDNLARQTTALHVGGQAFQDAMKNSTAFIGAEGEISKSTTDLVVKQQALQKSVEDMSNALKNNTTDAAGNVVSSTDLQKARAELLAVTNELNALNPLFAESLGGVTKAFNDQQAKITTLSSTVATLLTQQDGSIGKAEKLAAAQNDLSTALDGVVKSAQAQVIPIQGTGEGYTYMGDQAEALVQKQRDLTLSVQQAAAVVKVLNDQADSSPEHTRAVIQALTDWGTAINNTGGDLNQLQTIVINGVLFSGKLPDIIKQAQDQLKQFGGTVVSVADEFNVLGVYGGIISDTMKSNITVIKGSDDAMKSYNGTVISGHQAATQISGDVTKASNYFQQFTGSVDSTGAAIGKTLTPNLNSANSTLSTLSLEAEQAQKAMDKLGNSAKTTGDEIDQAVSAMDNWDSHMGSTDATGLGAWALAAQMTGETTFAGSGSARNSQGQQVSALTELQAAEQAAGNALAATTTATNSSTASTISNTNATVDNTKATDDATTSTAGLTATIRGLDSAGSSSVTSITSTSDAINNDLLPAVNFAGMSGDQLGISIDSLSSQLLSAGVVVDGAGLSAVDYATKLQNTVDGMNSAAKASANLSSASSSAAQGIVNAAATISQVSQSLGISTGPSGTTTTSGFSSVPTTFTNGSGSGPASAALPGGFTATSVPGLGQGAGPGGQLASDFYANPYQNTVSFASTAGQSYQGGYTGLPGASGSAIQLTMNYPQFNSQQQSQKTMNDVVTMLRTVPSLKL